MGRLKMWEILAMVDWVKNVQALESLKNAVRDRLGEFCMVELEYFFYRIKQREEEILSEGLEDRSSILGFFTINPN